jgi:hypothetical protein
MIQLTDEETELISLIASLDYEASISEKISWRLGKLAVPTPAAVSLTLVVMTIFIVAVFGAYISRRDTRLPVKPSTSQQ